MRHKQPASGDLFEARGPIPSGFTYEPELFSEDDERSFARAFENLPLKPFQFYGYQGNRRILSFGWRYDYGVEKLRHAESIADFLRTLQETAAKFSGIAAELFQTALVSEYPPGAGIGWHRDKPMFQDVVALSFLAPCRLRLRKRYGATWLRRAVQIERRSGYMLRGPSREDWEHSIPPMDRLRYSVTFRTFRPNYGQDW